MPRIPALRKILHSGQGFVVQKSKPVRRLTPQSHLPRRVDIFQPNFARKLNDEADMPDHIFERVKTTVLKLQSAVIHPYILEQSNPSFHVGGALVQSGVGFRGVDRSQTGNFGYHAAHLGIGTFTVNGKFVSQEGFELVRSLCPNSAAASEIMPMYSAMLAHSFALDSATVLTPAFFNLAWGGIETRAMNIFKGLLPGINPTNSAELEHALLMSGQAMVDALTNKKVTLERPIENRLRQLAAGNHREHRQAELESDQVMYGGSEIAALTDALRILRSDEFRSRVEVEISSNIRQNAADFTEKAEVSREEIASAREPADPAPAE